MPVVPIKTSTGTGYCDCICGCYDLVSLRDEDTGKGYCARCGKEHLELNHGLGIPAIPPSKKEPSAEAPNAVPAVPAPADPPGRLR